MIRFVLPVLFSLVALPALAEVHIQKVTSPGGITAWLVEEHSIPFTALDMQFAGGASLDLPGKRGATNLMTGLLEEGSGKMDSQQFAKAEDDLAASFNYDVGDDTLSVSARFLSENRDKAVDLLRQSLVEPTFPQDAIDRVREQVLSIIASNKQDPGKIASTTFDKEAFGDHPYATSLNGTEESVKALNRDDIVTAWKNVMVKDRVNIAAVGDITPEQLGKLLDRLLGDLPTGGAALPGDAKLTLTPGVTVVPYDTPQAQVIWAQKGLDLNDPDFFPAYILNTILGGGSFESRLMKEVRVKRGLTYGVYSYLVDRDHADLWMGSVASSNDKVAEAIKVIKDQWGEIAKNGVTAEELANAKKYMTGEYPLRFDGNGTIASILVGMQHDGMPIDYPASRNDKIDAVTLADVNRVAKEYLDPDKLRFVVVGQPEGLKSTD
ncbi:insulinase family protein [Pseudooceanicola sp. CBS1P-1]|uniref:Insulinase family protein n=1 Tax=Pseudooceanicola albus TaxID=2692189 RepID=A0A6L7G829_9RHOB|nr:MULTISPECIES: pitrilysin family protein [Pseudooceanicola]MBT9384154.1 insulinase family protein [Pseudooceanicola endophyticus]MXN19747.1 insulinase family protein [Pseudooceanicola albus]